MTECSSDPAYRGSDRYDKESDASTAALVTGRSYDDRSARYGSLDASYRLVYAKS